MSAAAQPKYSRHQQHAAVADGKKPPARSEELAAVAEPAPTGRLFVRLYDTFIDVLTEGCENGVAVELKLILQIMRLSNDREPGNPFGWIAPISRPALADRIGCEEQNLRCQWPRLFATGSLLEFKEGAQAVKDGICKKAPANSVCCRVRGEIANAWIDARRDGRKKAKEEAARKRAEIEEAKAAALAEEQQEEESTPRAKVVRRRLITRPVPVGPKRAFKLNEEQQDALALCTRVKFKSDGELRDFTVVEGAETMLIFDFVPERSDGANSEQKANKGASILALDAKDGEERSEEKTNKGASILALETPNLDRVDALSAALIDRGMPLPRRRVVIIDTAMPDVPLPFFLRDLDIKLRRCQKKNALYDPAWLPTAAKDAAEAWAEKQQVETANPGAKKQTITACPKCGGDGLIGATFEYIGQAIAAVRNGAAICDCPFGEITRDLVGGDV